MAETQLASAGLSGQAEEIFRGLWASVFFAPPEPPTSVLVCSASRGEGATTVACALALAGAGTMAATPAGDLDLEGGPGSPSGKDRVVLVDFNLRNPCVHEMLGLADADGVSDVLSGKSQLSDVLRHVGAGKLDVLTVGTQRDKLIEILRADRVGEFLTDLQRHYGHVIIDAAPPNLFPDSQVLAGVVNAVVLVAHSQQTAQESLVAAKRALEAGGGNVLGVVLNMRTFPIPKFVYRRV